MGMKSSVMMCDVMQTIIRLWNGKNTTMCSGSGWCVSVRHTQSMRPEITFNVQCIVLT